MKYRFLKYLAPAVFFAVIAWGGLTSCVNELDQGITDQQTDTNLDVNKLLAKIYANLTMTGTSGPHGNADMSQFDEGNSSFYRRIFEANELGSDICIWSWQDNTGIPELTNLSWNSSHGYNELTYYRMMYNITLCNFYLDETEGDSDAQTLQNRAEVRFMRALYYYYYMDLYGKAPFKTHYNDEELPVEKSRIEVFDYVVSELKSVIGEENVVPGEVLLDNANSDKNYGRADKVAAELLLARTYLNAEVYTGSAKWEEARDYAKMVMDSSYGLCTNPKNGFSAYEQLFMGDNGENPEARKEIIFPIRCDGLTSRSWGGTMYTIASTQGLGTPDRGLSKTPWTANRAKQALVLKFFNDESAIPYSNDVADVIAAARDDRAMFYSGNDPETGKSQRTFSTEELTSFESGLGIMKWSNLRSDKSAPSNNEYPDGDVPFMRTAEAYLTYAEANFRLGGDNSATLNAINTLRSRANATPLTELSDMTILDEWCREFYFEGRRRIDLVRFGVFTSGSYLWDWKGGVYAGTGVSSIYNIYPIPANELAANHNMHQNPGY